MSDKEAKKRFDEFTEEIMRGGVKSRTDARNLQKRINEFCKQNKSDSYRGLRLLDFSARAVTSPMIKQSRTFIANVLIGNRNCSFTGINPIRYLRTEPAAPPSATAKQSSICELLFLRVSENIGDVKIIGPLSGGSARTRDQSDLCKRHFHF